MKPTKYKNAKGEDRWQIQLFVGRDAKGKQINWKRKGFLTKNEALIAYSKLLEERDNLYATENALDKQHMTIRQLYEVWRKDYEVTVERSTMSKVESYFKNHILKDLGDQEVKSLKPYKLQRQIHEWVREASSGTVWARYLKKLYNYALLHEFVTTSPFDKVVIPSQKKNQIESKNQFENVLNTQQLQKFLEYWETKDIKQYAYFRLLAYSGMRRGEILALNWDDIDFEKRTLTINKSIGIEYRDGHTSAYLKAPKNSSSNRKISLDQKTLDILAMYYQSMNVQSKTDVLWPGKHGYMDANVPERWLQSMRREDNVDDDLKQVTLHGLRHTHATMLFEQAAFKGVEAPLKGVQQRLGHSTIEMTMNVYTHVTNKQNDIIDDILSMDND